MANDTKFTEGHKKRGGRSKGTPNKITSTIKEAVLNVFNELQKDPKANLLEFGKKNPKEFYQIAAKLIPTEVSAKVEATIVKVVRE